MVVQGRRICTSVYSDLTCASARRVQRASKANKWQISGQSAFISLVGFNCNLELTGGCRLF
ncbi:hypothetical protein CVS27_20065 [Arthrobacter glacialis]|uniref:Uncharacterized protein n=1 Tax=Arthrobacter glacialis TaxID=1664 RepID=A0A2S3ZQV4_ARTGL|nr:hypothetical protein CVS27_20065 [Arthrobacter glacialis]